MILLQNVPTEAYSYAQNFAESARDTHRIAHIRARTRVNVTYAVKRRR